MDTLGSFSTQGFHCGQDRANKTNLHLAVSLMTNRTAKSLQMLVGCKVTLVSQEDEWIMTGLGTQGLLHGSIGNIVIATNPHSMILKLDSLEHFFQKSHSI